MSPALNTIEHMREVEKHRVSNIQQLRDHYGGVEEDSSNNLCSSGELHAQEN